MSCKKRLFTLVEVMIAITLLALASGMVAWKMHQAVEIKRFKSQVERIRARFFVLQKLALSTQADWKGVLHQTKNGWELEVFCDEVKSKKFTPLRIQSMEILFNRKKVKNLTLDFFATGVVLPEGTFEFSFDKEKVELNVSDFFQREEGNKLGPLHPINSHT